MPKIISTAREIAYLRVLADTGNATLTAEAAGVSRTWAYKRREVDPVFAGRCREMLALAKSRLPARVNRDRAGGWTAEREERFIAALAATSDVPIAAASAGLTPPSAYRRRMQRPGLALRWADALRRGCETHQLDWLESAGCFFEGRAVPDGNPVRVTSIGDVLRMLDRSKRAERKRGAC